MPLKKQMPKGMSTSVRAKRYRGVKAKSMLPGHFRKRKSEMIKKHRVGDKRKLSYSSKEAFTSFRLYRYLDTFAVGSGNLDNAAEKMLAKGIAAVIYAEGLAEGEMLKIYPDNKKEVITLDSSYKEIIVRTL